MAYEWKSEAELYELERIANDIAKAIRTAKQLAATRENKRVFCQVDAIREHIGRAKMPALRLLGKLTSGEILSRTEAEEAKELKALKKQG